MDKLNGSCDLRLSTVWSD
uniref:Uncharacterized protein n=1 Tax=Anguilla anguilla TaxID=7936 RepID=A0A0E9UCZ9_ANGAN